MWEADRATSGAEMGEILSPTFFQELKESWLKKNKKDSRGNEEEKREMKESR